MIDNEINEIRHRSCFRCFLLWYFIRISYE